MQTTHPFDDDHLREECAIFGIYGSGDAAAHAALGLHALQHRGQEAAGIVATGNGQFHAHCELGLVGDIFGEENVIKQLEGTMAIGHTRYSTTGRPNLRNVQPLFADLEFEVSRLRTMVTSRTLSAFVRNWSAAAVYSNPRPTQRLLYI